MDNRLVLLATQFTMPHVGMLALSLVCLLQYAVHVWRQERIRRLARELQHKAERLNGEVQQLQGELQTVNHERSLQKLENAVLREVLAHTDSSRAIQTLLRRLVPQPDDAFAIFLPCMGLGEGMTVSRGLSPESFANLRCEPRMLRELGATGMQSWHQPNTHLWLMQQLAEADRHKAQHLYVFSLADDEGLLGVLISTTLLVASASEQERMQVTSRVLNSLAPALRAALNLELQAHELQVTREMLELRSMIDGDYEQPWQVLEQFLNRLAEFTEADHAALFLLKRDDATPQATLRCGGCQPGWIEETRQVHESRLVVDALTADSLCIYEPEQLACLGIRSLIATAAVMPVIYQNSLYGVLSLTRNNYRPWTTRQRHLITWAAETIGRVLRRMMAYALVERQARLDGLTGLANRRTFDAQLQHELSGAEEGVQRECALLLIDLDCFKSINDNYGHQAGDEVLRQISQLLKLQSRHWRSTDRVLLARYGGEELALLLPGVGLAGARRIGESIRSCIESAQVVFQGVRIPVTASVGVAVWPQHGENVEKLVAAADAALYRAKGLGRNRVVCAGNELNEKVATGNDLEGRTGVCAPTDRQAVTQPAAPPLSSETQPLPIL
ncbi:MAG: hypothetical protein KatS3mg114_1237 [Planctomycetaceae bacterium]|nr:MAG: hypothetical protein KatS3mg114_1237 [Planctomycetaceae bacterium]